MCARPDTIMIDLTLSEDEYGSDEWGDIDDLELIAAVDEAERASAPLKSPHEESNRRPFALPPVPVFSVPRSSQAKHYPSPASGQAPDVEKDKEKKVEQNDRRNEDSGRKRRKLHKAKSKEKRRPKTRAKVITSDRGSQIHPSNDREGKIQQAIDYHGTLFPRLSRAYSNDLAEAVDVAHFSLNLMEILTSLLREFLKTNIISYPEPFRRVEAVRINKMAGHPKADVFFHGWDFLALANLIIKHRNHLPISVRDGSHSIDCLLMLKTRMRWAFAHTCMEEQERRHPIELSLWAINTLLLIENFGLPLSYAEKVITLHQDLWSPPSRSSSSMSEMSEVSEGTI